MRKRLSILALLVALGLAGSSQAATVTLSITRPSAGQWQAWAQVGAGSKGISSFEIDVTADSGLTIATSTNKSPRYFTYEIGEFAGFFVRRSNVAFGLKAEQYTAYGDINDPYYDVLVIQDVGILPGNPPPGSLSTGPWAVPVLLAQGTYTGMSGWLHVRPHAGVGPINLLSSVGGGAWVGPGNVEAATSVVPDDLYIPEPVTFSLLSLGGLALTRRRRRVCAHRGVDRSMHTDLDLRQRKRRREMGRLSSALGWSKGAGGKRRTEMPNHVIAGFFTGLVVLSASAVGWADTYEETIGVYAVLDGRLPGPPAGTWSHSFDGSVGPITGATLTVVAEGVDTGEDDPVYFEGHLLGYLSNQGFYYSGWDVRPGPGALGYPLTELTTTVFSLDPSWITGLATALVQVESNWIMEVETSTLTIVPEPGTLALLALGLGGLVGLRGRRG